MASTRTPSINENAIPESLNILSLSNRSANDEKSTHASTETPDLEPEWIDTSFGLEFQRRCSCSYIKYHQKVNKAIKPCSYLMQTHFRSFPKTSDNSFNFFCSYANETNTKNSEFWACEYVPANKSTNFKYSSLAALWISTGLYPPKRSLVSVCSERFCTIKSTRASFESVWTTDVFPQPVSILKKTF